jgi:hypothetical protein
MSGRGVFAVSRGVFDHVFFSDEPYTEREAWLWLVGNAAWKSKRVRVGKKIFELKRGQCAYAERFMAEKWQWSKTRVHRFLERLKNESMIEPQVDRHATMITICNYDKFAFDGTGDGPQSEPQDGPEVDRKWTKEEELKKDKKEESKKDAAPDGALPDPSIAERELFARGRQVLGKSGGGLVSNLLKSKGGNVALARGVIEVASQKDNPREYLVKATGPPTAVVTLKDAKQQEWENARQELRHAAYRDESSDAGRGSSDRLLPAIRGK